jgi:lipoprotein NlpI
MFMKRRYSQCTHFAAPAILVRASVLWFVVANMSCMAQEPAKTAEGLLSQANSQLSRNAYDEAYRLAAEAAKQSPDSASVLQNAAEIMYLAGFSKESLPLFDRVVKLDPTSAPENWQRGIALCSCGEFERGAEQFKTHHDVNPDDVENSAWYFLCIAKTEGIDAARKTVIPSRGDSRQPMMSILKMLKGELEPKEVIAAAEATKLEGRQLSAKFYADLYVGLYHDSLGQEPQAIEALKRSQSYGISGYMVSTARVYLKDRFGEVATEKPQNAK